MAKTATLLGIHCAAEASKMALCVAALDDNSASVIDCHMGRDGMTEVILRWIHQEDPALLTLDTALGWPVDLVAVLGSHKAGLPLRLDPGTLFFRECDRMLKNRFGVDVKPVAAHKTAFNAYSTLTYLDHIGYKFGMRVPLAWDQFLQFPAQVIEVSPYATLASLDLPSSRITSTDLAGEDARNAILCGILKWLDAGEFYEQLLLKPQLLLAAIGVLAGHDFLRLETIPPPDMPSAKKEGWVWVRKNGSAPETVE